LQQLIYLDYLLVHSADANGPTSLHPPTPQRDGELSVRRGLIEQGLHLLIVRGLIERRATDQGFDYRALDTAGGVIASLQTPYSQDLVARAQWATETFGETTTADLAAFFRERFGRFGEEFTLTSPGWEDLP
jgi:hypothetical protein